MTSLAEVSAHGPGRRMAAADVIDAVVDWAPDDRIDVLRSGFPAGVVAQLAGRMGWTKERAIDALKLSARRCCARSRRRGGSTRRIPNA